MLEVSGAEVTATTPTSTSVPTVAGGRAIARSSASVEAALVQVAIAARALQRTAAKTAAGPVPTTLIDATYCTRASALKTLLVILCFVYLCDIFWQSRALTTIFATTRGNA